MAKDSFIFYKDWYMAICGMSDTERLKVYEAIIAYSFEGKEPENLSDVAAMAMRFILPQLKRDVEKYNKICERNQRNGAKGGRPQKSKTQRNPKNPVGNLETQRNPKNPVVLYDNDNDNENVTDDESDNIKTPSAKSQDTLYIDELIKDQSWQEMICMKLHISLETLQGYLQEFKENVELDQSNHRDRADFRSHVRNWLRKRLEKSTEKQEQTNVNDLWK